MAEEPVSDDILLGELTEWLVTNAGVEPTRAPAIAEQAQLRAGKLPGDSEKALVRLRTKAVELVATVDAAESDRGIAVEGVDPVVANPDVFARISEESIAEGSLSAVRRMEAAAIRNRPDATESDELAAAELEYEADALDPSARTEGGFMGDLRARREQELAASDSRGGTGATELLEDMRFMFGFEPDEGDIVELTEAIIDSGEYRIPRDTDELETVISQEMLRFYEGDREQNRTIAQAFAGIGNGRRRIHGQIRVGNKWIDYDPEVDPWLFGREREGVDQSGTSGTYAMRAESVGSISGELGWEVGGWLSQDPNRSLMTEDFLQVAAEEDIDAPYLAAGIELLGQWGVDEFTDEEVKTLQQNTREWKTDLDGEGSYMITRLPSGKAAEKGDKGSVTLRGRSWDTAVQKWNDAVIAGREGGQESRGRPGLSLGNSIAVARQKDEAARDLKRISGQAAIKSLESFKATVEVIKKKANIQKAWRATAQRLKSGEQQYGHQAGGLLSLVGGGLAEAYNSGNWSGDTGYRIDETFAKARYSIEAANARSRNRVASRRAYQRYVEAWDRYYSSGGGGGRRGGGGGGGGTVVKAVAKLPSEEDVKNSLTTLFRSWFRREPTDGEVAGVKKMLDGVIIHEANQAAHAQAYGGQYEETDKEALILDHIRKSPEYQKLFAGKAGGQTEEEYSNMFEQSAQELFGREMAQNDEAVRAGMMESREQTTLGYLAGTQAANESSSFQERLSNAARIVAELT